MPFMPTFQPRAKLHEQPASSLVVFCSDHRFQAGIQEFLSQGLRISEDCDLLVIPGGPQCLTRNIVERISIYTSVAGINDPGGAAR